MIRDNPRDRTSEDEPVINPTPKKLLLMFMDESAKQLGIPVFSDVDMLLNQRKNLILFAAIPNGIKSAYDNTIEVEYLKNVILAALESNQKVVLAYEALSDPSIKKVINDPEKLRLFLNILNNDNNLPETVEKELNMIIEIEEKYKARFEVEPIGLPPEAVETLSKEELGAYRRNIIVEEILDLLKKYNDTITVLFYTGTGIISVLDIFDEIEEDMKEGKGIINREDIANICVFVPPNVSTPPKNQDLRGTKRE